MAAASITWHFALPGTVAPVGAVGEDVAAHKALERELVALRARVRKECQINRRAELNLEVKKRDAKMRKIAEKLGERLILRWCRLAVDKTRH